MAVQDEPTSVAQARDRLDREAEAVRTEQLELALSRLQTQGDLSEDQRVAIERLSERLVDRVLEAPRAKLGESADGAQAARIVLELFD